MPFIFVWAKGKIERILVLNVPPSATFIRTWHLTLKNKTTYEVPLIWFISIFYKEAPAWLTDMSSHLWQQTINADCWVLSLYFPSLKSKFLTCKFLSSCIPSPLPTQMDHNCVLIHWEKEFSVFSQFYDSTAGSGISKKFGNWPNLHYLTEWRLFTTFDFLY